MFKLALKTLAQNKVRLGLTGFAIVLGVGFVVSSFVLRDGLKEVFTQLAEDIISVVDVGVSAVDPDLDPITQAEFDALSGIEGIEHAELVMTSEGYESQLQPIKPDGTTITLQGPPQLVFSWSNNEALNAGITILSGEAPLEQNQWVIDNKSLEEHGFVVGDTYTFVTPSGQQESQLVGTYTFEGFIEGPTYMTMQAETIREWMLFDERYDFISIVADGTVPVAELQASIDETLNSGEARFIVLDQAGLIADAQDEFNLVLDIIGGILLGFAIVALFVSIFIIANTFAITTSQRTRELGLLRAIGATPGQIRTSVLAESFMIGVISSLLGIGAGAIIALILRQILNALGLGIPSFDVVLRPQTVIYALVVGVTVTMLAAIFPAIGAARTSPIAAISGHTDTSSKSIVRFIIGFFVTAIGLALMAVGLFGSGDSVFAVLAPLGAGAAVLFVGVTLLSPLVAGPLSRILGAPLAKIFGTPGQLARQNSARNPRRTATTAAALMIGLSLVSMASVLGESFKAEFDRILDSSIQSDFIVFSQGEQAEIPIEVVDALAASDSFGNVSAANYWGAGFLNEPVEANASEVPLGIEASELGNYSAGIAALDYDQIDGLFNFDVTNGSLSAITNDSAAIRTTVAEDLGIGMGDTLEMVLLSGETAPLEVVAIFEEDQISNAVLISFDRFSDVSPQRTSDFVATDVAEGVPIEQAQADFDAIAAQYPNLAFQSSAEFRETFSNQIDFVLNLLTVLLGLTIIIAVLGIANTLALSVFERTREIGLLRAVGMTRKQNRRMIRWEAVIIAAVGAVLGTVLGVALGILMIQAIPDDIISAFAVPWVRIAVMVVVASAMGLLAALFPAWRASRMNVLDAISRA